MVDNQFFEESREQSQIKARIVAKYFWAWANVIIPTTRARGNRIAYIDLFAGPGRYEDGTLSTPLLVLTKAIEDPNMREMLQGVASFEYSRATETYPMLFELSRPLDDLAAMLLNEFAGQTVTMKDIYLRHSVDKPYIDSNYKRVLAAMEGDGKIRATPPSKDRPKRKGEVTFADSVIVSFPKDN